MVLAVVVSNRWFDERRGVVLGFLTAANATGQLVFLPLLARIVQNSGWRSATWVVAGTAAAVVHRGSPAHEGPSEDVGLKAYGWKSLSREPYGQNLRWPRSSASRGFALAGLLGVGRLLHLWREYGQDLIGTHLMAACHDFGIRSCARRQSARSDGVCLILSATASGWLTDRFSSRHLLFGYYARCELAVPCRRRLPRAAVI